MNSNNYFNIETSSSLDNLTAIRLGITAFLSGKDIHVDEIMDIKTAISEAITNAMEHAYSDNLGKIYTSATIEDNVITIKVKDEGKGIEDINLAMTPMYTTKPETEHAGMGFTIMESFMDEIIIDSSVDSGTIVTLVKIARKKKSN